jgi:hypothetical protein
MRFSALLLLGPVVLFAQKDTGEIRIIVKDAAGAAMAAAAVVESQAAQIRQQVQLPASGYYAFRNLPFGTYAVTVSRDGFATFTGLERIRSEVPVGLDVTMQPQAVSTTIEVRAADTLIDPDRTAAAYYDGPQDVKERSIGQPGRGVLDLVAAQPGWTFEANGILHPRESEYETQFVINGFPVQENRSPAFAPNVEADNVQSMKVYTSGIPAEFGQKMGGVIEIVTDENGSPGFHGAAVLQGGSFATAGGYLSGQYTSGKTTGSLSADGFLTDRFLDPAAIQNYTNHASSGSFDGSLERDFSAADRIRIAASRHAVHFLVPDELLQYAAGTREDRVSTESAGQISWQHVFSPELLGALRGSLRDVTADLWSNPLATPIAPGQRREYREGYANGSLAGNRGHHDWKVGAETRYGSINESFGFHIAAYSVAGVQLFDPDTPADFAFRGHGLDREQAAYAQDTMHFGRFTVSAGVRFDHYSLLVSKSGVSPRLGLAYDVKPLGLVLHASYDRTFGTPPFENILVSAAPQTAALNNAPVYIPLQPSRGNYYEAGFGKSVGSHVRLDASYFLRDIRYFQDDDLLENTGVSFPIEFQRARIRGIETKLQVSRWGRLSGYLVYNNNRGIAEYPIAGGLFLEDGSQALLAAVDRFPISQDQRNTARALARYQIVPRLWTSWKADYDSGLPTEIPDNNTMDFLVSQYGAAVVRRVNFDRGRVNPTFSLDASVGLGLWQKEKRSATLQFDCLNLTNRLNAIDFAGFLSGTAIAPPRSYGARLRLEF